MNTNRIGRGCLQWGLCLIVILAAMIFCVSEAHAGATAEAAVAIQSVSAIQPVAVTESTVVTETVIAKRSKQVIKTRCGCGAGCSCGVSCGCGKHLERERTKRRVTCKLDIKTERLRTCSCSARNAVEVTVQTKS